MKVLEVCSPPPLRCTATATIAGAAQLIVRLVAWEQSTEATTRQ
jgi:hypothetical protein